MNVVLRQLEEKDAPLMLEWMHDADAVKGLKADFMSKTIEDCINFINGAKDSVPDRHYAITDADSDTPDEYLGTVSLKHIDTEHLSAEFGIAMRRKAMGTGAAYEAMRRIIKHGTEDLKLKHIFWCVNPDNPRAVRFYDKNGYVRIDMQQTPVICDAASEAGYTEEEISGYIWYDVSLM